MKRWNVMALLAITIFMLLWPGAIGNVLRASLVYAIAVVMLSLPCGCILGIIAARVRGPVADCTRFLILVMLVLPGVLQAAAWEACLGLRGWLTKLLPADAPTPLAGWHGAWLVQSCLAIPWVSFLVGWRMRAIVPELDDDLHLTTSPLFRLWHGVYPAIIPILGSAAAWVLIQVLGDMTITDLFRVRAYAEELYLGYATDGMLFGPSQLTSFGAASLLIPGMTFLLAFGMMREFQRVPYDHGRAESIRWNSDLGLTVLSGIACLLMLILAGIPILSLVQQAGRRGAIYAGESQTWSFYKALSLTMAAPFDFRVEYAWTLALGGGTSLIGVTITLGLLSYSPFSKAARLVCWALCTVLLAIPTTTVGVGLSWLFSQPGGRIWSYLYDQTLIAPGLAALSKILPAQMLLISLALANIPRDHFELARIQGVSAISFLRRVAIPQIFPALVAAWLVGFLLTAGDVAATILVMPPGTTTLAVRVFGLMHAGIEDRLAALCLSMVVIFTGFACILEFFRKKWDDRKK